MAIHYDTSVIESFFGTPHIDDDSPPHGRTVRIDYAGPHLKYTIILQVDCEKVEISGDIERPFGGDSIYEIAVPCDAIVSGPDPYNKGQTCLTFYFRGNDINVHRRMTIMKTQAGELKVWPRYPFPEGHYDLVTSCDHTASEAQLPAP